MLKCAIPFGDCNCKIGRGKQCNACWHVALNMRLVPWGNSILIPNNSFYRRYRQLRNTPCPFVKLKSTLSSCWRLPLHKALSSVFSISTFSLRNPSGLPEIDTSKTELFVSRILPMFSELQIYPMTLLLYGKVCPEYPQVMDTLTLCKVEHNQSTRITISLNIYHVAPWTEGEMLCLVDSHPNQCDSAPTKQ